MDNILNTKEIEFAIGEHIKALRLQINLAQGSLAGRAGVSLNAVRHLETGQGCNLKTLIRVIRALGKEDWLLGLSPRVSIDPLRMVRTHAMRQRARRKKKETGERH